MAARQLALTPSLVTLVRRVLEDAGPDPNIVYHTEEDYDAVVRHLLSAHAPGQDLWLFAYGSLIWKPEVDHVEERMGMDSIGLAPPLVSDVELKTASHIGELGLGEPRSKAPQPGSLRWRRFL